MKDPSLARWSAFEVYVEEGSRGVGRMKASDLTEEERNEANVLQLLELLQRFGNSLEPTG